MKKFFITCLILFNCVSACMSSPLNSIKFGGKYFILKYKSSNNVTGGFINEYLIPAEHFETWTEMIAVHTLPNEHSYKKQIKEFTKYLESVNAKYSVSQYDENTSPIIDFIIVSNKKYPTIVEFNIFKYEKTEDDGLKIVQYAKRYIVKTALDVDLVKAEIQKSKKSLVKKIQSFEIPEMQYTVDIEQKKYFENLEYQDVLARIKYENSVEKFIVPAAFPVKKRTSLVDSFFDGYLKYDEKFIIDVEKEYMKKDPIKEFFGI